MPDSNIESAIVGGTSVQKRSSVTRLLTSLIISLAIITALAGMIFYYAGSAAAKATDAKKKLELASLHSLIITYYITEEIAPENVAGDKPCIIGKLYDDKSCLRELARDGYGAPPVSPNDEPYLYYNDDELFYVATQMRNELPPEQRCPYSEDPSIWCKAYLKD